MNTIDNFSIYASPNTLDGLNAVSETISTDALLVDGTNSMNAPLNMASHTITNLANGVNPSDAAAFGQISSATSAYLPLIGGNMTGAIAMGNNKIAGIANGTVSTDAAAFGQIASATSAYLPLAGGTMSGILFMGWNKIQNVAPGGSGLDAPNIDQMNSAITTATSSYLPKSGGTMTGPIAMGASKITGIGNGALATDAAAFGQIASATSAYLPLAGGTMSGPIAMGTSKITGIGNGALATDAAAFGQIASATSAYLPLAGGTMSGPIAMGTSKITGVGNGTLATDAAAFGQIASATANYLPLTGGTISGTLSVTGVITAGSNTNMSSHKITQLLNGTANQDAAAFGQIAAATANYLPLAGGTVTGALNCTNYLALERPMSLAYSTPYTNYINNTGFQGGYTFSSFGSKPLSTTITDMTSVNNLNIGMYIAIAQIGINAWTTNTTANPSFTSTNMTVLIPTSAILGSGYLDNGASFTGLLIVSSATNSLTFRAVLSTVGGGTANAGGYLIALRIA